MSIKPSILLAFRLAVWVGSTIAVPMWGDAAAQTIDSREAISNRVEQLSAFLDGQAKRGEQLSNRILNAPAGRALSIFRQAQREGGAVAQMLAGPSGSPPQAIPPTAGNNVVKSITAKAASDKARSLSEYAQYLHQLSDQIKTSPPNDVLSILRSAYLPREVQIVIDPSQLPPLPSMTGASGPINVGSDTAPLSDALVAYIVGGGSSIDYPAVGALLYDSGAAGISIRCTGTLIATNVVLTAAHCAANSDPTQVYFQHGGIYEVDHVVVHEQFAFPYADVMLVFLKSPVLGILPLSINDVDKVAPKTDAHIVGFGYHSSNLQVAEADIGVIDVTLPIQVIRKAGIKLHGVVTTQPCAPDLAGKSLICWVYDPPSDLALYGSTCEGDSGGPLVTMTNRGLRLAGTTVGGRSCMAGDRPADVEVFDFSGWIKQQLLSEPKPIAAQVPSPLNPLSNKSRRFLLKQSYYVFDPSHTSMSRTFSVDSDRKLLRVAVNATSPASILEMNVGPAGDTRQCVQKERSPVLYCEFVSPVPGSWSVTVTGVAGQEVQLVGTIF